MFPGAGEEEHEEEPVHPLFEAGATGADHHIDPLTIVGLEVNGLIGLGNVVVDVEDVVKHPLALVEEQQGGPIEELIYLIGNRVKIQLS